MKHIFQQPLISTTKRENLLYYNTIKQNNRIPLVLTYSKALPDIHTILRKNMKTLHKSERMKNVFKELPIVSYKRNKNIKDILVHRKHSIQFYNRENKCKRCGENCALCKHLIESSKFQDNEGKIYNIHGDINCKSTSVIYCIFCTKCDKNISVDQTGDTFCQRILLLFFPEHSELKIKRSCGKSFLQQ